MGKFLAGFLFAIIVLVVGGYLYLSSGMAPAATAASPMPFEKRLARIGLNAHIKKEMPTSAAIPASEANLLAGAEFYKRDCAVCHGLPGGQKSSIAAGMYPPPPQLFEHGVTDDPAGETYWKVANGIRLTGMPAFKGTNSDEALWQVSLMLANADKLPTSVTAALAAKPPTPGLPPANDTLKFPATK